MRRVRINVELQDCTFLDLPEHHEPSTQWIEAKVREVVDKLSPCRAITVDYEWKIEEDV